MAVGLRVFGAAVAHAQEAPVELARLEFLREAEAAARRGEHAPAIELARRAAALRMTPSIAHFLAREHAALGQHLASLAQATACARGAEADRSLHNRETLLRACNAMAERATTQVGRVVVQVADALPEGIVLRVAGTPLPVSLLGAPYAVAPGEVEIEAEAPGRVAVRRSVTIAAGGVETVLLQLAVVPVVVVAPVEPIVPTPVLGPVVLPVIPPVADETAAVSLRSARRRWAAVGIGLTTLAVGSFVASGVVYASADDAQVARDAACPSPCEVTASGYAAAAGHNAQYRDRLSWTTATLVGGAALTVGTALWWLLARPLTPPRIVPTLSARVEGVSPGFLVIW